MRIFERNICLSQSGTYGSGGSGPSTITLDGDTGSASGSTINVIADVAGLNCGSSVQFVGNNAQTLTLNVTDSSNNTVIGEGSGAQISTSGGVNNTYLGCQVATQYSGSYSVALGYQALFEGGGDFSVAIGSNSGAAVANYGIAIGTNTNNVYGASYGVAIGGLAFQNGGANYNVGIGYNVGANYTSTESNNILLNAVTTTVAGENNTLRIGDGTGTGNQQLQATYISGIDGVALTTANVVTETGNQLGTAVLTAGSGITIDATSTPNEIIISSSSSSSITITTDDGNVQTGSAFVLSAAPPNVNNGSTVAFDGNGSNTMYLDITDTNANIIMGLNAGNTSLLGDGASYNTSVGAGNMQPLTTGSENCAFGYGALNNATTTSECVSIGFESMISDTSSAGVTAIGNQALYQINGAQYTVGIGYQSGANYTSTETSNIAINALSTTVTGENNTLRIGDGTGTGQQQLQAAYISGIDGVNVGSVATVVTEYGNQLGTAVITAGSGISVTPGANTITIASTVSSGITTIDGDSGSMTGSTVTISGGSIGLTTTASGSTMDLTGTLNIAHGGTNATSFTQSNGIVTYNGTSLVNYAGPQINSAGVATNTSQPAFLYILGSSVTNATGNGANFTLGTSTALTKVFDQGNNFSTGGTFTAPTAGIYRLGCYVEITACTIATTIVLLIVTTSATYQNEFFRPASNLNLTLSIDSLCQMSSGDTATFVAISVGEAGNTDTVYGNGSTYYTRVYGNLVC